MAEKQKITRSEKFKKIDALNEDFIHLYNLGADNEAIKKGNENIKVLYKILLKEINHHNGQVMRKINKVISLPEL